MTVDHCIVILRLAGYEILTNDQVTHQQAKLDRALKQAQQMREYNKRLLAQIADLEAVVASIAPSNHGVQPTAELSGREGITAESETGRQPAVTEVSH